MREGEPEVPATFLRLNSVDSTGHTGVRRGHAAAVPEVEITGYGADRREVCKHRCTSVLLGCRATGERGTRGERRSRENREQYYCFMHSLIMPKLSPLTPGQTNGLCLVPT